MPIRNMAWLGSLVVLLAVALPCVAAEPDSGDAKSDDLPSKIVAWEGAPGHVADWGEMRRYFTGKTHDTENVLVAVAVVKPGETVHKAHRHVEEEYLALVEGSGTWSLDGKESPAKRGDILYVAPWVFHGITNTGDEPLIFLVVRYNGKGVAKPPRPDDRADEME